MNVSVGFISVDTDAKIDVVAAVVEQAAAELDVDMATIEALDGPLGVVLEHVEHSAGLRGASFRLVDESIEVRIATVDDVEPVLADDPVVQLASEFFDVERDIGSITLWLER